MKGAFGKPLRCKTICFWTRDDAYYQRNNWAGRIKDDEGNWILDSPANNAMAHFLHNLLYLLGDEVNAGAVPAAVEAELYCANSIENYDTIASKILTENNSELLFFTSHCTQSDSGPAFHLEFEDAEIIFNPSDNKITAVDRIGNRKNYGCPDDDHQFKKLFHAVDSVLDFQPVICGIKASKAQIICVNGIQESAPEIRRFPQDLIKRDDFKKRWYAEGLQEVLMSAYQDWTLPNEMKIPWTVKGNTVYLLDYDRFPKSE